VNAYRFAITQVVPYGVHEAIKLIERLRNGSVFDRKKEEFQTICLAKIAFFKKPQFFGLGKSQCRNEHLDPGALQEANIVL